MDDSSKVGDSFGAQLSGQATLEQIHGIEGNYHFELTDSEGNVLWLEDVKNLITTVGKNQILNSSLAGSAYTAAEYMGLISSASFSAVAAADTMTSHAGWLEAGATNSPHYTAPRPTITFAAASGGSIALSASASFVFTNSGTVQGGFIDGGTGATNTIDNTGGVLISAGTFSAAQPVISGNTLNVSYSATLT